MADKFFTQTHCDRCGGSERIKENAQNEKLGIKSKNIYMDKQSSKGFKTKVSVCYTYLHSFCFLYFRGVTPNSFLNFFI